MKKIINILSNLLVIFSLIILIISTYYLFETKILKKDYANILGYSVLEISTGSMSGSLEPFDVIIVKLGNDVNVGDIVTYKQNSNLITHRIIEMDGENIITKGDANNVEDMPITKNSIIGKVVFKIENLGIWKKVMTSPQVLISLTITIILVGITIIYNPKDNKKENKSEKKNYE